MELASQRDLDAIESPYPLFRFHSGVPLRKGA